MSNRYIYLKNNVEYLHEDDLPLSLKNYTSPIHNKSSHIKIDWEQLVANINNKRKPVFKRCRSKEKEKHVLEFVDIKTEMYSVEEKYIECNEIVIYYVKVGRKTRILMNWYLIQVDVLKKEDIKVMKYFYHKGDRHYPNVGRRKMYNYTINNIKDDIVWVFVNIIFLLGISKILQKRKLI